MSIFVLVDSITLGRITFQRKIASTYFRIFESPTNIMTIQSRVFVSRGANDALDPFSKSEEAESLSRATKAAVVASKSILLTGGSEDMAIRTAKAAAFSVFCPNLSEAEINSRKGASYLKRRQFKKQAEAVASVALVTAKAQAMSLGSDERDQPSEKCERNTAKDKRTSPVDPTLEKPANVSNKKSASSVVSGKTGPTTVTAGISTAGDVEQSSAHYVRIRQTDEPSAITNPTKFDEPSTFSDPSESKRPTSLFVQKTREKIRRRNNLSPKTSSPKKVQDEEHPMKLSTARKQKLKSIASEEANWFENVTNLVNIAWTILTCGNDCTPPVEFAAEKKERSKDDRTLVTRTGMEIKCDDGKDQISTVTPCPAQSQDTKPDTKGRGNEAPGQYRSFPENRDEVASDGGSRHADSLVERWSQSFESEHSSIDESVSRLMHSFSSTESEEIQIRSSLRETMERVVERSKHKRTVPVDADDEAHVVSYIISHKFVSEPKKSEFSVRTRKLFALLKKNARKRFYEA